MKKPDEYEILERAHQAAGAHMMQKSPRADELIACLEGEIAKRDARILELEAQYQRDVCGLNNEGDPIGGDPAGGYANDNARLREELAAIKAQVPVTEDWAVFAAYLLDNCEREVIYEESLQRWVADMIADPHYGPLFRREAAPVSEATIDSLVDELRIDAEALGLSVEVVPVDTPVSEAKAQGVVMPEREECDDDRKHPNSWTDHAIGWNACLDEIARLNAAPVQQRGDGMCNEGDPANRCICREEFGHRVCVSAPVQQVSLPVGWKLVPVEPTKAMLFACEDAGSIHNQQRGKRIYNAMLAAAPSAPAAPAADAGLVEALETIINPIEAMRRELQVGEQLNGMVAMQLASDPEYLRGVAKAAIAAHRAKGVV